MRNKLHLRIPSPCHEEWNNMKPVRDGRFCLSCQKSVVDFTNMSDTEIINYFKKPSTGSVCGRFNDNQLNRDMLEPRKGLPWIKYFFQFTLPAFLISMKVEAQKGKPQVMTETIKDIQVLGEMRESSLNEPLSDGITINGKILDEGNNPLPGASIQIKGTHRGTTTNANGDFSIKIDIRKSAPVLVANSVGFQSLERTVEISDTSISKNTLTLVMQPQMQGFVSADIVIKSYKKNKKNKLTCSKDQPVPLFAAVLKDTLFSHFSVYPNPVLTGQSMTIENKKLSDDNYSVEIMDLSGQTVHQQIVTITGKQRLSLKIPVLTAGNYFLRLTGKNSGKSFSEKIIVQ